MLDYVDGSYFPKRAIREGERVLVEVRYYVSAGVLVPVDTDRAWELVNATSDI